MTKNLNESDLMTASKPVAALNLQTDARTPGRATGPVALPVSDYKLGEYKCPSCGWVHVAIKREFAIAHNYDLERLGQCFSCGAPSGGFVPAEAGDAPLLSTLQAVVLKADDEDQRISQELLETAADLSRHGVMDAQDLARIQALCIPRRGDR